MYCSKCGKEFTTEILQCDNCGSSIFTDSRVLMNQSSILGRTIGKIVLIIGSSILIILLVIGLLSRIQSNNQIFRNNLYRDAYDCAMQVISEDVLLSPLSAKFPKYKRDFVKLDSQIDVIDNVEYNIYIVDSYVDSENAFGTYVRCNYVVEIYLPKDNIEYDDFYYHIVYAE